MTRRRTLGPAEKYAPVRAVPRFRRATTKRTKAHAVASEAGRSTGGSYLSGAWQMRAEKQRNAQIDRSRRQDLSRRR